MSKPYVATDISEFVERGYNPEWRHNFHKTWRWVQRDLQKTKQRKIPDNQARNKTKEWGLYIPAHYDDGTLKERVVKRVKERLKRPVRFDEGMKLRRGKELTISVEDALRTCEDRLMRKNDTMIDSQKKLRRASTQLSLCNRKVNAAEEGCSTAVEMLIERMTRYVNDLSESLRVSDPREAKRVVEKYTTDMEEFFAEFKHVEGVKELVKSMPGFKKIVKRVKAASREERGEAGDDEEELDARSALMAAIKKKAPSPRAPSEPVARGGGGGALKAKDDPRLAKYFKMLKVGLPPPTVKHKMMRDGVDPSLLDDPEAIVPKDIKPAGSLKAKDDPRLTKYFKMLVVGLPPAAVKHKMAQDGVNPDLLDDPNAIAPKDISPGKKVARKPDWERRREKWRKEHAVGDDEFDIADMEEEKVEVRPKRAARPKKKKAKSFMDHKEELRFSIFLRSVADTPREFIRKCDEVDVEGLRPGDIQTFRDTFPSSALLEKARKVEDIHGYTPSSQLVWYAAHATNLKKKLDAMVVYVTFDEDRANIRNEVERAQEVEETVRQNMTNLKKVIGLYNVIIHRRVSKAKTGRDVDYWSNNDPLYLLFNSKKKTVTNPTFNNELEFAAHMIIKNISAHADICQGVSTMPKTNPSDIEETVRAQKVAVNTAQNAIRTSGAGNESWSEFFSNAFAFLNETKEEAKGIRAKLKRLLTPLAGKVIDNEAVDEFAISYKDFCRSYVDAIRKIRMRKTTVKLTKAKRRPLIPCPRDESEDEALNPVAMDNARFVTGCSEVRGSGDSEEESLVIMHHLANCIRRKEVNGEILYHPNPFWTGKRIDLAPKGCETHTTFGDVLPIQPVVSDTKIREKIDLLRRDADRVLKAGVLVSNKGLPTLTDGHHSFVASIYAGRPIRLQVKSKKAMAVQDRVFCNPMCRRCGYLRNFNCTETLKGSDDNMANFKRKMGIRS